MSGAAIDKCCGPVHGICRKTLLRSSRHARTVPGPTGLLKGQLERSEEVKTAPN